MNDWNNAACIGYAIMAAEKIGLTPKEIQALVNRIHDLQDSKTLEEAEKAYKKSPY